MLKRQNPFSTCSNLISFEFMSSQYLFFCTSTDAMRDFDRENFLGKWYEIERYFAVSELASRCVSVTYERRADGKIYVNNEMTNRLYVAILLKTYEFPMNKLLN